MKRSQLKRRTPLKSAGQPLRRSQPTKIGDAERDARDAWAENLGPCIVCEREGGHCDGPVEGHHAVDKQTLKRHGFWAFLWDLRIRVPVCRHRHEQHTNGYKPIPRELLPASVFEFADELGLGWWLDKRYPAAESVAA